MSKRKNGAGYQANFVMLNTATGEISNGVPVYVAGKARWDYRGGWFMGFQEAFGLLARDKTLTGETLRVWMHLLSILGFENFIVIEQKEISKAIGVHVPHISRAIKVLVEKGLLIKGPRVGRSCAYRLSLKAAWRGNAKSYNENKELASKKSAKEVAKERWQVYQEEHAKKQERT